MQLHFFRSAIEPRSQVTHQTTFVKKKLSMIQPLPAALGSLACACGAVVSHGADSMNKKNTAHAQESDNGKHDSQGLQMPDHQTREKRTRACACTCPAGPAQLRQLYDWFWPIMHGHGTPRGAAWVGWSADAQECLAAVSCCSVLPQVAGLQCAWGWGWVCFCASGDRVVRSSRQASYAFLV